MTGAAAPRPALAVGVGLRPGTPAAAVRALLDRVAAAHGLDLAGAVVATLDRRAAEPGLCDAVAPAVPHGYPAAALAAVAVPGPSARVAAATGTPSVAEAAALLAAGPGARLLVTRTVGDGVTLAVGVGSASGTAWTLADPAILGRRRGVGPGSPGDPRRDRARASGRGGSRTPSPSTPAGEERR
ncbi:cobalamin biosynthesis protein [Pseudonocardia spirodelae]|uniref:Cobalamin biosynthesis protein n=1 Tax=Pseudonocardia spirodelae TaxID=3133431 RepID=A0ABU8T8V8_9PSEU